MIGSILGWLAVALVLLAIIGIPLISTYQAIRSIVRYLFGDWYNRKLFFINVDPSRKEFLQKNITYYNGLSNEDRQVFERRLQKFIDMKNFEGREGLVVTADMETMVAAVAIQITFGFPSVYLKHFDRIILYPGTYYSTITGNYHHGEVNTRGIIVLSWKNLLEGNLQSSDGRNLALHELAHALKVSDLKASDEYDFLDREYLLKFTAHARREMHAIANGEPSFFRDYAATNDHEFFAVAVENFFERPTAFIGAHPDMYDSLVDLLNQNPLQLRQ
jgi:MtfA peptidase